MAYMMRLMNLSLIYLSDNGAARITEFCFEKNNGGLVKNGAYTNCDGNGQSL